MIYSKKCPKCGHESASANYFGTKPDSPKIELTDGEYDNNFDIETNLEVAQYFSDIDFLDT